MQLDQAPSRIASNIDETRRAALAKCKDGALLTAADMREIFALGRTRFFELQKLGAFDKFKVKHPVGPARFSGVLVQQHLDGEDVTRQRVFAGSRRR
jgi:hypothetical protein